VSPGFDSFSDDPFDMMDRIFGGRYSRQPHSYIAGHNKEERIIDKDKIYYTFELRGYNKEDIDIISKTPYEMEITLNKDGMIKEHTINLPHPIKPKETKITFINCILDITTTMDKEKSDRLEIED